jgi:hypothetical protein
MGKYYAEELVFHAREGVSKAQVLAALQPIVDYESAIAPLGGAEKVSFDIGGMSVGLDASPPREGLGVDWVISISGDAGHSFDDVLDLVCTGLSTLCDEAVTRNSADDDDPTETQFYGSPAAIRDAKFEHHLWGATEQLLHVCRPEIKPALVALANSMRR